MRSRLSIAGGIRSRGSSVPVVVVSIIVSPVVVKWRRWSVWRRRSMSVIPIMVVTTKEKKETQ